MTPCLVSVLEQMKRKKNFDNYEKESSFNKCLNTVDLIFFGLGQMIGAGIYILTGQVIGTQTGPLGFVSFIIAGLSTILNALCYAELAARFPKVGSAYVYTYIVIGEFMAFIIGWILILQFMLIGSSVAQCLSGTIDQLTNGTISSELKKLIKFPDSEFLADYPDFLAGGLIIVICLLVLLGPKLSTYFNMSITVLNIIVILIISITMFTKYNISTFAPSAKGGLLPFKFGGLLQGAASCVYAYVGFDCLAACAEEVKDPKRSIPIAISLSVGIVCILYIMASLALPLFQPWWQISTTAPFATAFQHRGLIWAKCVVGYGSLFGISASLFSSLFTLPRLAFSMANDGLLFRFLAYRLPSTGVPFWSLLVFGAFTAILAIIVDLGFLVESLSAFAIFSYTNVNILIVILRYQPNTKLSHGKGDPSPNEQTAGALHPRFQRIPILRGWKSGVAVTFGIIVYFLSALIMTIVIFLNVIYKEIYVWWNIMLLVIFGCLCISSIFVILIHEQDQSVDTFKVPFVPVIPCISIFINSFLIVNLGLETIIKFIIWICIGGFIYIVYGYRYSKLRMDTEENRRLVS